MRKDRSVLHRILSTLFPKTKNEALWKTFVLLAVSSFVFFYAFHKENTEGINNPNTENTDEIKNTEDKHELFKAGSTQNLPIEGSTESAEKTNNEDTSEDVIENTEDNQEPPNSGSTQNPSIEGSTKDFDVSLRCPLLSSRLKGRQNITFESIPSLKELEKNYTNLLPGGRYSPSECRARQRVAIIIPFRDREEHLVALLYYLHPFLQRQQIQYGIYIVEQEGEGPFNRGMLMNIGFLQAQKVDPHDCFIFHDVDLIPEDDRNLYLCSIQPRHMSVAINNSDYRLIYGSYFGGVSSLTTDQIKKVNGFNNLYWGWGGEDDDMSWRVTSIGLGILRYSHYIGRYTMMSHEQAQPNPERGHLLGESEKLSVNGLNDTKYDIVKFEEQQLYTWILVKLEK